MGYEKYVKRVLDVVFAIVGLLILAVPMLIISIFIKATSQGPVLFKQLRYGKHSKSFVMYKFRSMALGTPEKANQEFSDMDEYITCVGSFLRKTSLDELPQLWNVLKGDMSFVGPRPLAESDIEVVRLRQQNGGDLVRPGITGWAQVNGRNKISNQEKAAYDAEYATNLTFLLEFKIIWLTLRAVALREGINHNDEKSN